MVPQHTPAQRILQPVIAKEARRHLREKQIIFGPTCLTIAPSYVRQLRKSLNLVAPSRVSTWLPLDIGIPQSRRTRAWCQTRFLLWCRVLSRSGALAALSSSRTDFLSLRLTDRLLLPLSAPSFPPRHTDAMTTTTTASSRCPLLREVHKQSFRLLLPVSSPPLLWLPEPTRRRSTNRCGHPSPITSRSPSPTASSHPPGSHCSRRHPCPPLRQSF